MLGNILGGLDLKNFIKKVIVFSLCFLCLSGTVKAITISNLPEECVIAICPEYGTHEAHAKAVVQAFYNDKYLGPWTLYQCSCGEVFACDGRTTWNTGAYVGNYSTNFEYDYVDSYSVINLKSYYYLPWIPDGWSFFP